MGKTANGNSALWIKITTVLMAVVLAGGGWWLDRVDNQATAQAATITGHAVKIARAEATQAALREDVAEIKAVIRANAVKLDDILRKVQ